PSTIGVHKAKLKKAAQRQITQGVVTMDKQRRRSLKLLSGVCAATALPGLARAQRADATAEQISLIVPYGAGGSTDYIARLMAADLATRRSGSFIVENKAGAAGNIGTRYVAISAPDGKTLLYSTATPFCINPYIYQTLPYDPDNGFDPIALTVQVPLV
uniref:Bug family tripartite tricarboxylate transporter substrate binding protein n=1 Tax=Agrobacterium tumefaciens TaxID=358 RepID=UPI003B9DDBC6